MTISTRTPPAWSSAAHAVAGGWLAAAAVAGAAIAGAGADDLVGSSIAVGAITGVVGAVVGAVDVRERRIPNVVVLTTLLAAGLMGLAAVIGGRQVLGGIVAGGLVAGVPLLIVHLVTPRGMGFGDVKYAAALGALLGVLDWRLAMTAVLFSSLIGGLVGLAHAPWRRSIPFGLFLSVGGVVALATARFQS